MPSGSVSQLVEAPWTACTLISRTPGTAASGANCRSGIERNWSLPYCGVALPADADLEAVAAEARRPFGDPLGIGGEIGHVARDRRLALGSHDRRQAHQRRLVVEAGAHADGARDVHVGEVRREQPAQRFVHHHRHLGAARGDQRRVAHELDGVAGALLRVKQHLLAGTSSPCHVGASLSSSGRLNEGTFSRHSCSAQPVA